MTTTQYLEEASSKLPALQLLINMGYQYLTPDETVELRGGKRSKVVLEGILEPQLKKLNSITFKGESYPFTAGNIARAVGDLINIPVENLMHTNEAVYDLIILGKSLEQTINGNTKSFSLKYIDWQQPENNLFHVTSEFVVERVRSHQIRRIDIVLFINGIPLVVIECKRPDKKDAISDGISQNLRNQRPDQIPHLFIYNQLVLSICRNKAMYGTCGTQKKFWSAWKEDCATSRHQQYEAQISGLINRPLNRDMNRRLTGHLQQEAAELFLNQQRGERLSTAQDRTLFFLLRPERLLELTQKYMVYDANVKKVARYQQYFAVRETLARINAARGDQPRTGGVIWHTTGSGKSLTMVMLAKSLAMEPGIENPRIILVTDRVDLDEQIFKTFVSSGKVAARAKTGEHLIGLVSPTLMPDSKAEKIEKVELITTVMDKFEAATRKRRFREKGRNIFILVDESHRSQYGISHAKMKAIFPNACYIGFTGTPLMKREKSTADKFGGFIHKYTMDQAVKDNTVTPLLYEGRMSELHGDRNALDKWFDRITKDLTDQQKADLKRKFRREEELTKKDQRIAEIAYDISVHYQDLKNSGLKGQLACAGKEMALKYKKYLDDFGMVSSEVVISPPDTRENHIEIDESAVPEVQQFWKKMMDRYGNEKKYVSAITDAFKNSDDPEIIIVVDKLLTGFDAPGNGVLYIDKRLKGHNILQTVSRVNRLFEGKRFGLIIDYRGIFGELNEALEVYSELEEFDKEDLKSLFTDTREEIAKLAQRHANLWAVFNPVSNKSDMEAMQRFLEPENIRQSFYEALNIYSRTLQIALANSGFHENTPESTINTYIRDLKDFRNLRAAIKQRYSESIDCKAYESRIRNMVNRYISADEVKQIIEPISIFETAEFEKELETIKGDAAKADTILYRIRKTILERMEEDPVFYTRLSRLIQETIDEHRAKRMSDRKYLEKARKILNKTKGGEQAEYPEILKEYKDARSYYDIVSEPVTTYTANKEKADLEKLVAEMSIRCEEIIEGHKIRDWTTNPDIVNAILNDLEDYLFAIKGKYELDLQNEDIDKILDSVIQVAKRRDRI